MDLSQVKVRSLSTDEAEVEKPADPFASDVFADPRRSEPAVLDPALEKMEKPAWIWRIPKVSRLSVDWNALLKNSPADLSDDLPRKLAESLSQELGLSHENSIALLPIATKETTGKSVRGHRNSCWLSIGVENSSAEAVVEVAGAFAAWLIDTTLGESAADIALARNLTASEIAVLEFLTINLTHEANAIANAPLFRFRSISQKAPDLVGQDSGPLLVSTWQAIYGRHQGVIKLCLSPELLLALQVGENKLLTASPRRETIWHSLRGRVSDVRSRIFIGDVQASLAEVATLESGDIVLLENHRVSTVDSGLFGRADVFLGDGENVKISGAFQASGNESIDEFEKPLAGDDNKSIVRRIRSKSALQFAIEHIEGLENPQLLEKSMPEEEATDLTDQTTELPDEQGAGVPIENLAVTLRVELEGRRLSLADVANLRIDQTIELGARPTDPVNLLIDNKVVARGELVEVDEHLGVRIIQILR